MDDEILDVVDENDVVTGTINRKDYDKLIKENLGYIRAAELFIVNDEGKIWVPVRTATKTIAPNGYDYSAAGHVESGDTYIDTIIRETEEEINLIITEDQLELIAKIRTDDSKYFRCVYVLRSNDTPLYNDGDFVSAAWLTPAELIANIESGHPAKQSLRDTAHTLQEYLRNH